MEHLKAVELLEFINQMGTQEDPFLRHIFLEVANSIHKLHKAGIAHRDIKLDNIMITDDLKIKIIDVGYGIALCGRK